MAPARFYVDDTLDAIALESIMLEAVSKLEGVDVELIRAAAARVVAHERLRETLTAFRSVGSAEASVARENRRRESSRARILARLMRGPATGRELGDIASRFGSRIDELRKAGHIIPAPECLEPGLFRYVWLGRNIEGRPAE
jgi:hypothetical protein